MNNQLLIDRNIANSPTQDNIGLIVGFLFILVLGLLPAYILSSGGFQLVDVPLVAIIAIVFFSNYGSDKYLKIVNYLLPYTIWAIIVNMCYFIYYNNIAYVKVGTAPVVYAPILIYTFMKVYNKLLDNNKISYIYLGLILSIIVTFTAKGVPQEGKRAILSFNDPNQLGYFSVIFLSYVVLLLRYKSINNFSLWYYFVDAVLIFIAHFLLALSVSRSAMAAVILLDICILKNIRNIKVFLAMFFSLIIGFIFIVYVNPQFIQERLSVRAPAAYTGEAIKGGLAHRALSPLYYMDGVQILVGLGQGGLEKSHSENVLKKSVGYTGESHNILEIFRGYGLIGSILFLFWFVRAVLASRLLSDGLWIWGGILLFNMGNYGLRWRALWILLAFLFAMIRYSENKKLKNWQEDGKEGVVI